MRLAAVFAAIGLLGAAPRTLEGVPRFAHVVVIVDENKNYDDLVAGQAAPNLAQLARAYGSATRFYGEVHPSEANYVALLGGDTFGIHDDDPFTCHPGDGPPACSPAARERGYADHTVHAPHLGDQLAAAGQTWRGYYESLPAPGSLAITASDPRFDEGGRLTALYASKHSGFLNFASAQADPHRADHIVGFDRLDADLAHDSLPAFALIVPNQCNDMHGLYGARVPADCRGDNVGALIRRGDAVLGALIARLQASRAWKSRANMAIVITFDEGAGRSREGCCSVTPQEPSNFGGGHIPTVVITNHGPRGFADPRPYNHYSLLRTIEDALGVRQHLGRAGDTDAGVAPMQALFGGA